MHRWESGYFWSYFARVDPPLVVICSEVNWHSFQRSKASFPGANYYLLALSHHGLVTFEPKLGFKNWSKWKLLQMWKNSSDLFPSVLLDISGKLKKLGSALGNKCSSNWPTCGSSQESFKGNRVQESLLIWEVLLQLTKLWVWIISGKEIGFRKVTKIGFQKVMLIWKCCSSNWPNCQLSRGNWA